MNYLIMSNDFRSAADKAASMDLNIREWSWCPSYSLQPRVDVYVLNEEL